MKPKKHYFIFFLLLSLIVYTPFSGFSQITKKQAQEIAKKKEEEKKRAYYKLQQSKVHPFYFTPGNDQKIEIPITPKTGLFNLKITWKGNAGELKAKLVAKSNQWTDHITVVGRNPLHLTYLFDNKQNRVKKKWFIIIENSHPDLEVKGFASMQYSEDIISLDESESITSPSDSSLLYSEFLELDRSQWGESKKDYTENGAIKIEYSNGNWVLQDKGNISFYDAEKDISYDIIRRILLMNAMTPSEPPALDKFTTDEVRLWSIMVGEWIKDFNHDLFKEIKALLNNDEELIERYTGIEAIWDFSYFKLAEFRMDVIKDLRAIYGE